MPVRSEVISLDVLDDGAALARFNADLLAKAQDCLNRPFVEQKRKCAIEVTMEPKPEGSGVDFKVKVAMEWKTKRSVPGEGAAVEGEFVNGVLKVEYDPSRTPVQGELRWDGDRPDFE